MKTPLPSQDGIRLSARTRRLALLGISVLFVAIHLFALHAPYFTLDDGLERLHVRGVDAWTDLLGRDFYQFIRPVKNLLFLGFLALEPLGMVAVRSAAIAIGILALLAVFAALRRITRDDRKALIATAIWALAPTLVSSVAWLSCVNILIMTALGCAAFCLHDHTQRALEAGKNGALAYLGALALLTLAMLAYEGGISLIPLLVVTDWLCNPSRARDRKRWMPYGGYLLAGVAYVAMRLWLQKDISIAGSFVGASRGDVIFASAWFTLTHLWIWLAPFGNMAAIGGYVQGLVAPWVLGASWLAMAGILAMAALLWKRLPLAALGILWWLIGFAPMSNLAGFRNGPYGDYYLTLASIGLALFFAEVIALYQGRTGWARRASLVAATALLASRLAAVPVAAEWASVWNDPAEVFSRTVHTFPQAFDAHFELAKIQIARGKVAAAEDSLRLAAPLAPHRYNLHAISAILCMHKKDWDQADRCLRECLRLEPGDVWAQAVIGWILENKRNNPGEAELYYRRALAKEPWKLDSLEPARNLALMLATRGVREEAVLLWRRVLRLQPEDGVSMNNLGITLVNMGKRDEGMKLIKTARRLSKATAAP